MNAEISCRLSLRLVQSGQRTTRPQCKFDVKGVIGRQPMIAAYDLYGPGDLLQ